MEPEQLILGGMFSLMGMGTMLFPKHLIPLSLRNAPENSRELNFVFRCFGAQATLCGLLLLSCKPSRTLYRNFGLAMVPFFIFDYVAWNAGFLTEFGALGDAAGNLVFSICSFIGWKRSSASNAADDED